MSAAVAPAAENRSETRVYAIRVVKIENGRSRYTACGHFFLHAWDGPEYLSEVLAWIQPAFPARGE